MANEDSFLGTGWSFPPAFDRESGSVEMVQEEKDIRQSLEILLSTSIGERVMQPLYGCNLRDYQFEPVSNTFIGFLVDMVERAILFFEPRILVENISITEPGDIQLFEGKLLISIDYVIAGTNSRYNYVYDFYLREADRSI
ncbi:GPW/gp25 family protein [Nitrosomonas sp.]|uniref:GPW/gp25 family protein n=1 Tax=Nitrosomonas sp. TaxID=42353 RepID=UPI002613715A|nr:GPW/gp25 family protein [Nitrosomonas sp.]MCW5599980.1 GPW/gp25 family protein [Nitrosomonas sp.]